VFYLLIIFCDWREKKENPTFCFHWEKDMGPLALYFFPLWFALFITFAYVTLPTHSLSHTPFALFFISFHISSTFIHLSIFLFLSISPSQHNTHQSRKQNTEHTEERREKHTQKVRERKGFLFSSKSSAASSSRTLSLLLSFA